MKTRLAAFVLAIALLVSLIVWTALTSARLVEESRTHLALADSESFRIARQFQKSLLDLNDRLLQFALHHKKDDWTSFEEQWNKLNTWIDQQHLKAPGEMEILNQLNAAYDDYHDAARKIESKVTSTAQPVGRDSVEPNVPIQEFNRFEKEAGQLLNLSFQLAEAHRQTLVASLAGSSQTLGRFQALLLGALFLIVLFGAWLARFVYKQLIAPLQLKLVESQALLERQEKLASLGTLAAGVAHEIRNPLTAIKAWLFIHQRNLQPGTQEQADAKSIGNEIDRLERIVKDFLIFARPSDPKLQFVSADEPLREVHQLLAPPLEKAGIRFIIDSAPPARVKIDPQQIKQVLINLVQNASEAVGPNGVVTLRARLDRKPLPLNSSPLDSEKGRIQDAEAVVFEVADTGKGIPPEVEKRLFDPFFSTKENGTGLGLSIAARIVEKHGGLLQYRTRMNHGTTFGIVLPRAE